MALTDQPYLPLYVQDWLSNNKLKVCSMSTQGLMINIMCLMHKENEYGCILLKQKFKQKCKHAQSNDASNSITNLPSNLSSQCTNFACMLAKLLPFDFGEIERGLAELIFERILIIEGDSLICKRMVYDAKISTIRALAGKRGGIISTKEKRKIRSEVDTRFAQAKNQASAEYEYENENKESLDNNTDIIKDKSAKDFQFSEFSLIKIYNSSFEDYKKVMNGQLKDFSEEWFNKWKYFVDYVSNNEFQDLFIARFPTPVEFKKLVVDHKFTEETWEKIIRSILATGVRPEHNLFFRIPKFIEYGQSTAGKRNKTNVVDALRGF